jgi:WD40 repeat protein
MQFFSRCYHSFQSRLSVISDEPLLLQALFDRYKNENADSLRLRNVGENNADMIHLQRNVGETLSNRARKFQYAQDADRAAFAVATAHRVAGQPGTKVELRKTGGLGTMFRMKDRLGIGTAALRIVCSFLLRSEVKLEREWQCMSGTIANISISPIEPSTLICCTDIPDVMEDGMDEECVAKMWDAGPRRNVVNQENIGFAPELLLKFGGDLCHETGDLCHVAQCCYHPVYSQVVTLSTGSDSPLKLWNTTTGKFIMEICSCSSLTTYIAFNKDGSKFVRVDLDFTINIWDYNKLIHAIDDGIVDLSERTSMCLLRSIDVPLYENIDTKPNVPGENCSDFFCCKFSPDGKYIAAGSDATLKLYDTNTGLLQWIFVGHIASVKAVDFTCDGSTIVTGSDDLTMKLWNMPLIPPDPSWPTARKLVNPIQTLVGHRGTITDCCFSPSGDFILSASWDSHTPVRLWKVKTGQLDQIINARSVVARCCRWYRDGKSFAVGTRFFLCLSLT